MRARLLEATVELLVERGFAGTSTTLVSERAGVSRGAQLHHFPTKNDLVVAAVEHLTELRGAELADAVAQLPTGKRRTRAVLEMLGDHFTSPVFTAALELWVAARTDAALLAAVAPLEQRVGRETHRLDRRRARRRRVAPRRARAGAGHPRPGARARPGRHDHRRHRPPPPDPRRVGRRPRHGAGREPDMTDVLTQVLADLAAEGDRLEALVADLDDGRLAHADPRARLGRRHPGRPPRLDRRGRRRAATDKEAWDAVVLGAIADPEGFVDAQALAARPGRRPARPLAPRPRRPPRRARALPTGEKMPWFGPPMSATSMATARLMETWAHSLDVHEALGACRRGHRPDPARRPPRRPHPRLRVLRPRARRRRPRSSASSSSRRRARSGPGVRRTPRRP